MVVVAFCGQQSERVCCCVFLCTRSSSSWFTPLPPHVNDIRVHLRNEVTPYRTYGPSPMMMAMTRDWSAEKKQPQQHGNALKGCPRMMPFRCMHFDNDGYEELGPLDLIALPSFDDDHERRATTTTFALGKGKCTDGGCADGPAVCQRTGKVFIKQKRLGRWFYLCLKLGHSKRERMFPFL